MNFRKNTKDFAFFFFKYNFNPISFLTLEDEKSGYAGYKIGDKIYYNIVDTPGVFDTDDLEKDTLDEIARTIQKCAHGIKAILFVFGEWEYW